MENIYTIINTLNKVSNESVMESDKETNAKDPMQETPFSSDSVTKLLDAEQQIAGIKSELKNSMMSRLAELAGVPLAEIEEAIGETPEAAAARIKEGHCEACGCEMANPDPTCECGASGGKTESVEKVNEYKITTRDGMEFDQEAFNLAHATYILAQKLVAKADQSKNRRYDPEAEFYAASDYYGYPDLEELGMPMYYDLARSDKREFLKNYQEPPVVNPDAIGESVEEGNEFSGALAQAKKDGKEEFEVDGKTYKVSEAAIDGEESPYVCVHAKKGKYECSAESSYGAAKKAAAHWGLKNTAGIDTYLADITHTPTESAAKPDFADIDGDGDKDEDMKKAAKDKEKMDEEFEDEKVCDKCDEKMDDCKCEKVEETTTSGAVAVDASGNGKALYKNPSVYESNEIVRAASKLMEGMNINISMNDQSGPSLTVNATDEDAMKLGALLKLAGLGNLGMQHDHVHEEQEFANGADDTATADTDTLVNGIAGGLNGPKQQVNPNNPGDNPLAMQNIKNNTVNLGESDLEETSASHLMELYKEFKAK